MSTDDPTDDTAEDLGEDDEPESRARDVRKRIEQEADRAREGFDEGIVDLMTWVLDTETRARIYLEVRQNPDATSEEIASGTGLYPSTVREALSDLHEEGRVSRQKRESDGAGNNPYEYSAIPPSELVVDIVDNVQSELNTVFNLDRYLDRDSDAAEDTDAVTIDVEEEAVDGADGDGATGADAADADDDEATDEDDS